MRAVQLAASVAATFAMQLTLLPSVAHAQAPDARKLATSADALGAEAGAHYQQKRDAEAYAAYEEWLKSFGAKATPAKRKTAETRLKELAERTGQLSFDVAEPGAAIVIDDKPVGTSPLAAPLRLASGPHRVRVTKEGFVPFDQTPNVAAGQTSAVLVKLEAQSTKGRLSVKEKSGKPIRVFVDGVDMGDAPWSGEVDAGQHEVSGRSGAMRAAPEKVTVERGKAHDVELAGSTSAATLKIGTSDGKGLVYLDGKLVGEGTFSSEIPAGTHTVRITREGYDPFEEQLDLKDKETLSRSVTLTLSSKIETGAVQQETRPLEGLYGGFGLLMTLLPSGMNHSMEKTCQASDKPVELTSCDGEGGSPGGGLTGFIGYHWDPVGIELYGGAQYDQSSPTLTWGESSVDPGIGPDPARTEEFKVRRIGGFGAFRVRLTFQSEKLRFSVAGGVGLSYRSVHLTRDTTATANSALRDVFVPDGQGYLSPVISLEPSLQYRLSPKTAVALGLSMLIESASAFDQTPTTPAEGNHRLGASGLTTPSYQLATETQVFIGPFIGMMFGP